MFRAQLSPPPTTMSEPSWAPTSRVAVPAHVQPGSTRSSFARPDKYNLPHTGERHGLASQAHGGMISSSGTSSASGFSIGGAMSSNSPPHKGRPTFAARQRGRGSRRSGVAVETSEEDLPPTLGIRSVVNRGGPDFDEVFADISTPGSLGNNSINTMNGNPGDTSRKPAGAAVIVFGFPPGFANEVLQHFGHFGEIVENSNFDGFGEKAEAGLADDGSLSGLGSSALGADSTNGVAVECGRNWLRVTYRDRSSAVAALAQNGRIMPGQYVVGCMMAEASEYSRAVQQSSTNSLLLDDTELSFVHEQSLAGLGESSTREDRQRQSRTRFEREKKDSHKSESKEKSGAKSLGENSKLRDEVRYEDDIDKIVPRELSDQLFRPHSTKSSDSIPVASMFTTTAAPKATPESSLVGKVTSKLSDLVFGWDV